MYLATASRSSIAFIANLCICACPRNYSAGAEISETVFKVRNNSFVLRETVLVSRESCFLPRAPGYVLTTWLALVAYVTFLVKHASEHEIHISNKFDKK